MLVALKVIVPGTSDKPIIIGTAIDCIVPWAAVDSVFAVSAWDEIVPIRALLGKIGCIDLRAAPDGAVGKAEFVDTTLFATPAPPGSLPIQRDRSRVAVERYDIVLAGKRKPEVARIDPNAELQPVKTSVPGDPLSNDIVAIAEVVHIGIVMLVTLKIIVPGPSNEPILAKAAPQRIVAESARNDVISTASADLIISGTAVKRFIGVGSCYDVISIRGLAFDKQIAQLGLVPLSPILEADEVNLPRNASVNLIGDRDGPAKTAKR